MQVQINLTFPLSAADWNKLIQLQAISALGPIKIGEMDKKIASYIQSLSSNVVADEVMEDETLPLEELSDEQKMFLDSALEKTYHVGETMVLDQLSIAGVGKGTPSVRELILHYMKTNNGNASRQSILEYVHGFRPNKPLKSLANLIDKVARENHIIKDHGMWSLPVDCGFDESC